MKQIIKEVPKIPIIIPEDTKEISDAKQSQKSQSFILKLMVIGFLGSIFAAFYYFNVFGFLTFTSLEKHIARLHLFVHNHYSLTVLSFIGCYMLATALSIPGTVLFMTTSGLLFGVIPGIIYAIIGVTCGSTLLLVLVRYIFGSWFQQRYAYRLKRFNNEIDTFGYYYLLLVRFAALLPTCLINIFSSCTLVPIKTFFWTTAVGVLPISIFYTLAGDTLAQLTCYADLLSYKGLLCIGFFVVPRIIVIPLVIRFVRIRRLKK